MNSILLAAALQSAPIAPPLPQSVADCDRPTYATDQLVCSDPGLRAADRELARLVAMTPAARPSGAWLEDQQAWFSRSRRCAFQVDQTGCVAAAYRERAAVLAAVQADAPAPGGDCRLAGGTHAGSARSGAGTVLVAAGRVVAVALPAGGSWKPFMTITRSGRSETLRDLAGTIVARCTVQSRKAGA